MAGALDRILKLVAITRATVPMTYVQVALEVAEDRGLDRARLQKGVGLPPGALDRADGRVPLIPCVRMIARAIRLTGDKGLGYEFGLRNNLSAHGEVGYGLLSHETVGEAIAFGLKYGRLRNPILKLRLFTDGAHGVIEAREAFPLGPLRQYAFDAVLVMLARIARQMGGGFKPDLEIWFDGREPAHFARYRARLPRVRFGMPANQLRFPASYLDRRLSTANKASARQLSTRLDQDLALLGDDADVAGRVRALLGAAEGRYPDLPRVAAQLHLSERSLKRRLQEEGATFLGLLAEARRADSVRLLADPALDVQQVAARVGYSDPASFTRAFRKWTGRTPSAFRRR